MREESKIFRIVDKEVVSMKELRWLSAHELVREVSPCKEDDKYKNHLKYLVKLTNEDIYWVYVKREFSFSNFIEGFKKK